MMSFGSNYRLIIFKIVAMILMLSPTVMSARFKTCYVCRSRGPLGDCGDPFNTNSSSIGNGRDTKAVEMLPCPSGWCGKTIEGKDEDPLQATERMCLQRPPADLVERCSDTFYELKREKLFMCFCRGNLCNHSSITHQISSFLAAIIVLSQLTLLISF